MSGVPPGSAAFVKAFINVVCVVRKIQLAWQSIPPPFIPIIKGSVMLVVLSIWFMSKKVRQIRQDSQDRAFKLKLTTAFLVCMILLTVGSGVYLFSVPVEPEPTLNNTRLMWAVVLLYSLGMNIYFR